MLEVEGGNREKFTLRSELIKRLERQKGTGERNNIPKIVGQYQTSKQMMRERKNGLNKKIVSCRDSVEIDQHQQKCDNSKVVFMKIWNGYTDTIVFPRCEQQKWEDEEVFR